MNDSNCIFCKIVKGEVPSTKIYEDEDYLAFLDIRPLSTGHSLVIPKKHIRWVWDLPNIGSYFEIVKKIALAQKKAFGVDLVESKVIGDEVPHAHVWVFPDPKTTAGNAKNFLENADKIRRAIP